MILCKVVALGCVYLEVKHDGWKTLKRKWERKLFWSVFGWVGRKENKWWGPGVFSLSLPKCFLPKIKRKLSRNAFFFLDWQKCLCMCTWALSIRFFFFWAVTLFFFLLLFWAVTFPLFFLFFLFFIFLYDDFLRPGHAALSSLFFFFGQ